MRKENERHNATNHRQPNETKDKDHSPAEQNLKIQADVAFNRSRNIVPNDTDYTV